MHNFSELSQLEYMLSMLVSIFIILRGVCVRLCMLGFLV